MKLEFEVIFEEVPHYWICRELNTGVQAIGENLLDAYKNCAEDIEECLRQSA